MEVNLWVFNLYYDILLLNLSQLWTLGLFPFDIAINFILGVIPLTLDRGKAPYSPFVKVGLFLCSILYSCLED